MKNEGGKSPMHNMSIDGQEIVIGPKTASIILMALELSEAIEAVQTGKIDVDCHSA